MLKPSWAKRTSPSKLTKAAELGRSRTTGPHAQVEHVPALALGLEAVLSPTRFPLLHHRASFTGDLDRSIALPKDMGSQHPIGLLLATEEDWPTALETLLERVGPVRYRGETHVLASYRSGTSPSTCGTSRATRS